MVVVSAGGSTEVAEVHGDREIDGELCASAPLKQPPCLRACSQSPCLAPQADTPTADRLLQECHKQKRPPMRADGWRLVRSGVVNRREAAIKRPSPARGGEIGSYGNVNIHHTAVFPCSYTHSGAMSISPFCQVRVPKSSLPAENAARSRKGRNAGDDSNG